MAAQGSNHFYRSFGNFERRTCFQEKAAWTKEGVGYPAQNVDELDFTQRAALGGQLATATLTIEVLVDVIAQAQLVVGDYVEARGQKLQVLHIGNDGGACQKIYCEAAATAGRF